ncbi:MAG: 50S ribosomal protein L23, partial [Atopobiaceae bacterium]|nr:50S ribosomal protein L23 [Atopobiaceae bacterium]
MNSVYDVIIRPIISERSMDIAPEKKYTFKVATDANKTEIKQAVEEIFGVEVKKVNVMNMEGKLKRMGRTIG